MEKDRRRLARKLVCSNCENTYCKKAQKEFPGNLDECKNVILFLSGYTCGETNAINKTVRFLKSFGDVLIYRLPFSIYGYKKYMRGE